MKKTILLFVAGLFIATTSCKKENPDSKTNQLNETNAVNNASQTVAPPADGKYPEFTFETIEHDFGTIKEGDEVSYDFKFKNSGEADLQITNAKGSCGCTVPDYPKNPLKPGEEGIIKVSFNSTGKVGLNTKSVTLMCNTKEGNKVIQIKANVEPALATK